MLGRVWYRLSPVISKRKDQSVCYFDFDTNEFPPNAEIEERLYIFYLSLLHLIDTSSLITKLWDSLAEAEKTKVRNLDAVADRITAINANYEVLKTNGLL